MGCEARMSQAGYFSEFVKGTGMAELAFRSWNCDNGVCALEEGECWERWVLESLLRQGVFLNHPINS